MTNFVYIGESLDGYISAPDGSLDWLNTVPVPDDDDLGFSEFMEKADAVVMGRKTFETVIGFGQGWPYSKPGIVLSSTMTAPPAAFSDQVRMAIGTPEEVVRIAGRLGYKNLYVDGGKTIQQFLRADLIDEMIVTDIPILLGGGDRLFGSLEKPLGFELIETKLLLGQLVRKHYRRVRNPG